MQGETWRIWYCRGQPQQIAVQLKPVIAPIAGCVGVRQGKPLDSSGGTDEFGQGVKKRMFSKSGTLEPRPTETHFQWGRPTGLGTCSGARRRAMSTECTNVGSSYPLAPQRLAPGGWEEWETERVEFESKGRPDGCPREYRKLGVMLCGWDMCVMRRQGLAALSLMRRRKTMQRKRPWQAFRAKQHGTFIQSERRIFNEQQPDSAAKPGQPDPLPCGVQG